MSVAANDERTPSGAFFWAMYVVGALIVLYGFIYMAQNVVDTNPPYTLLLGLAFNIAHDAVVAPVVLLAGFVVSRIVPRRIRGPVSWGLIASAMVVIIGFVPLTGYGEKFDNPSLLPLDYPVAVATVLAVVWAIVLLLIGVASWRRRSTSERVESDSV